MPQMAPMSWMTLMIFFSLIFMIFNSMNYFSFTYPSKFQKLSSLKKTISWKW